MRPSLLGFFCALSVTGSILFAGCARTAADPTSAELAAQIEGKERQGLEALKSGNLAVFGHSTADDAIFIDSHGLANKAEVMKNVADFKLVEFSMENVKLVRISGSSGLIAYTLTESGISHGHDFKAKVYVSALWAKRGGEWNCLFSQETGTK
jgi:hypothetical protein